MKTFALILRFLPVNLPFSSSPETMAALIRFPDLTSFFMPVSFSGLDKFFYARFFKHCYSGIVQISGIDSGCNFWFEHQLTPTCTIVFSYVAIELRSKTFQFLILSYICITETACGQASNMVGRFNYNNGLSLQCRTPRCNHSRRRPSIYKYIAVTSSKGRDCDIYCRNKQYGQFPHSTDSAAGC